MSQGTSKPYDVLVGNIEHYAGLAGLSAERTVGSLRVYYAHHRAREYVLMLELQHTPWSLQYRKYEIAGEVKLGNMRHHASNEEMFDRVLRGWEWLNAFHCGTCVFFDDYRCDLGPLFTETTGEAPMNCPLRVHARSAHPTVLLSGIRSQEEQIRADIRLRMIRWSESHPFDNR